MPCSFIETSFAWIYCHFVYSLGVVVIMVTFAHGHITVDTPVQYVYAL